MARQALTIHDPQFSNAVSIHLAQVRGAIVACDDPEKIAKLIGKSDTLASYAEQIKTDAHVINQLKYAKLLACGRYGQLCPATLPKERGRGNKISGKTAHFKKDALSNYRKLGRHMDQIEAYYEETTKQNEEDPDMVDETLSLGRVLERIAGKNPARVKQYTGNAEWYTPKVYVDAARAVMGGIDCDPASCAKANRTIKAKEYFNAKADGLTKDWKGRIWLNPPYGRGVIDRFADKLIAEIANHNCHEAIVLTNNTTDTKWWHTLAVECSRICFTLGRIKFNGEHNNTNGQTFLYYGAHSRRFIDEFSQFGLVFPPN